MSLKVKPSMSARKVYLLLESSGRNDVEKTILDYVGVLGWAKASPVFVEGGKKEGRIILAVNRTESDNIRAAFEASNTKIRVLKLAGTLKSLEK